MPRRLDAQRRLAAPRALAVALLAALLGPNAALASGRPVVVELFTSEGCSSCPPAEAYLNDLAHRPGVLPLAYHVTYWDRLGWKDRYSLEAATARQARYGAHFGDGSYTPEMVVDGVKALVGSNRQEGDAAITAAGSPEAADVGMTRGPGSLSIRVGTGAGHGRLVLVGFDPEHRTAIGRGENTGRTVTESNVVRSIRDLGAWAGGALSLTVPPPEGEDAAVLLEAPDGRILGAARSGT